jgi:hypothetical protein
MEQSQGSTGPKREASVDSSGSPNRFRPQRYRAPALVHVRRGCTEVESSIDDSSPAIRASTNRGCVIPALRVARRVKIFFASPISRRRSDIHPLLMRASAQRATTHVPWRSANRHQMVLWKYRCASVTPSLVSSQKRESPRARPRCLRRSVEWKGMLRLVEVSLGLELSRPPIV